MGDGCRLGWSIGRLVLLVASWMASGWDSLVAWMEGGVGGGCRLGWNTTIRNSDEHTHNHRCIIGDDTCTGALIYVQIYIYIYIYISI